MNGVNRVTLGHERAGDTSVNVLNFLDGSNRERARLWLDPTGAGSLRFKDENGVETRYPPELRLSGSVSPASAGDTPVADVRAQTSAAQTRLARVCDRKHAAAFG